MNKNDWIAKVKTNYDVLYNFISCYHPINLSPRKDNEAMTNITAVQAERACELIRKKIRQESLDYPDVQFNIAVKNEDYQTIYSLLSASWFGVPENTECWNIPGFNVACDLMDDPIDQEWDDSPLA